MLRNGYDVPRNSENIIGGDHLRGRLFYNGEEQCYPGFYADTEAELIEKANAAIQRLRAENGCIGLYLEDKFELRIY
jgi:hypothetical protein